MSANQHDQLLVRWWYLKSSVLYLLLPLSFLYWAISSIRRGLYKMGWLSAYKASVPVIVIGNITVGGTGKTPLTIALVNALQQAGFKPGIISRGYGSAAPFYPFAVTRDCDPKESGDEPLLMAKRTSAPVIIDADRSNAVELLLANNDCDVIISDDGLQHYALQRDIEIAMVDANRAFGNNFLLPAGPLREGVSRLASVDYVVTNGQGLAVELPARANTLPVQEMQLHATELKDIKTGTGIAIRNWRQSKLIHAVAGIGNPKRFFITLRKLGFTVIEHSYQDHYRFKSQDLQYGDDLPIIMTEKDAVKVAQIEIPENSWFLPVDAIVDDQLVVEIVAQLHALAATRIVSSAMKGSR